MSTEDPIKGWEDIARAVGRETNQSVSERTAQRYAEQGQDNRLPVYVYGKGRTVFLKRDELALWVVVFLRGRPTGARPAGSVVKRTRVDDARACR